MDKFLELVTIPHIPLYHYTSVEGLLGIISGGEIWATKISYLNDKTEFSHALEIGKAYLEKLKVSKMYPEGIIEHFLGEIFRLERTNIFVCSFTEDSDLLSQWRGYGGGSVGYSIGFSGYSIHNFIEPLGFTLAKCVYDEDRHSKIVHGLFDYYLPKLAVPGSPVDLDMVTADFISTATLIKNKKFDEEKEWRLVSNVISVLNQKVRFRASPSSAIPYFALPIRNDTEKIKIERIVCGPSPHETLTNEAVRLLMIKNGYEKTEIINSKVPLRKF